MPPRKTPDFRVFPRPTRTAGYWRFAPLACRLRPMTSMARAHRLMATSPAGPRPFPASDRGGGGESWSEPEGGSPIEPAGAGQLAAGPSDGPNPARSAWAETLTSPTTS